MGKRFDEWELGEAIASVWGRYGAHYDLFQTIVKRLAQAGVTAAPRPRIEATTYKNHTILLTLQVQINNKDYSFYTSERISEILDDAFRCERCGGWHLNPDLCGMDEMSLSDIEDIDMVTDTVVDDGVYAEESRIERGQNDWSEGRRR